METTYLLAGGDRRQFWLSRLLVSRGRVFTRGVPGLEDSLPEGPADVLIQRRQGQPLPCRCRRWMACGTGAPGSMAGPCPWSWRPAFRAAEP